ncbi:MAG: helix-turn-helix transcriptional regulator [Thermodesulfobacteriota bacterium]|nr:helix-turn-helix transcriptional regulator [Thermodesulfobacteriota bacterium]
MKKAYSSGIEYLDNIMGGILLGDNVVWVLEPGTYFDYFLEFFLTAKDGSIFQNIFISFDFPPQKIYTRYKDYFDRREFILVDAFTFGKGKGDALFQSFYENEPIKSGQVRIHCVKNVIEHTQFVKTFQKIQEEFQEGSLCKYVFESLTGMQELWGERETLRFFTYTCPKLFELKALAYWPLAKGAHSDVFLASISHITQLVISLSFQKDSSCTAKFLNMTGRPSHLLNVNHYYNFEDNRINFVETPKGVSINNTPETGEVSYIEGGAKGEMNFALNNNPIKIGTRIRGSRKEKNLSQVELARILKITPSALSQIENDLSLPSLPLFVKIARFFGKSLDSFFVNSNLPSKK